MAIVEIVTTGTELLLGQVVNTNAAYLAKKLNELGFDVLYQTTVGDNPQRMREVFELALQRADLVVTSGGLGPTYGDITKEVAAELVGKPLLLDPEAKRRLEEFFHRRGIIMPARNQKQALVPEGAVVLYNERGTAPGIVYEVQNRMIVHLPGPPGELKHMVEHGLVPLLMQRYPGQGVIFSRVLRVFGLGESQVEERLADLILQQENPTLALLAQRGEIWVRLTAKAEDRQEAERKLIQGEGEIRRRLYPYVFGQDQESLDSVVAQALRLSGLTISTAESCTGGLLAARLTEQPGSSTFLMGAIVAYDNRIKQELLAVPAAMLAEQGAVSEETARAMAAGVRERLGTDVGVGVTGIAGPDGGSADKPVGLVYIAVAAKQGISCEKHIFNGVREEVRYRATQAALDQIRRMIAKENAAGVNKN